MIGAMGSISLVFSIFIINLYSHQILNNQQQALQELILQEVGTLQEKNANLLQEFGLRIQHNPIFKQAFKKRNVNEITELLNDEFSQYYITARILSVNKIFVYDLDYNLVTASTEGDDFGIKGEICPQTIEVAKKRTGSSRVKTLESLCYHDGRAFDSMILPIGSIRPHGYIHILSDPVFYLKKAEQKLKLPLKIKDANDQLIYETPNWESLLTDDRLLLTHYIYDDNNKRLFTMLMHRDISKLNKQSESIQNLIIIAVILVTLIAVLIFIYIFDTLMLKPLHSLTQQLSLIAEDKNKLGTELPLQGSREIMHLTSCFNTLHEKLSELYNSLENIAFTDQLTALPNRSQLQEILAFHTNLNQRDDTPFVLFMMDLDRFKSVNDTLGHHAGDLLLQQVGERLSTVVRKSDYVTLVTEHDSSVFHMDVVARLGGDEFAAVLPAVENLEDAKNIAEKILQVMNKPFVIEGNTFSVGVSIGIVACPIHGRNPELLMQHADVAMYHAKNNRQGFMIYDSEIDKNRIDSLTLEDDLREAIKNDLLSLVYQPKISLKSNKIVGVEVLLRWIDEKHGFIPPDRFIPIAEQSGLINEVSQWVIEHSLSQKASWDKMGVKLSMAINISAKNLLCKAFLKFIEQKVEDLGLKHDEIFLEITETAVMSDPVHSIITLRSLKNMGFKLSIDDFGTGYSSLSYLKKLPVDEIKIDRSFVMDMEKDENDAIIVQSTIDLAHNMGLSVTAEGVENKEVLEQLRQRKSDCAQGYYMCRPANSDDLEKWLAESEWGIKPK